MTLFSFDNYTFILFYRLYIVAILGRYPRDSALSKGVCIQISFLKSFYKKINCRTGSEVVDAHGKKIKYYPEVPEVLKSLNDKGYEIGIASRTSETRGANQLLKLFGWDKYIKYTQIYPGCKVKHFTR